MLLKFLLHQMQEFTQVKDVVSQYFPRCDSPRQSEHTTISPSLSYSNFNSEIEFVYNPSQIGYMSPYSNQVNLMDNYGNWNVPYEGYDKLNLVSYQEPF